MMFGLTMRFQTEDRTSHCRFKIGGIQRHERDMPILLISESEQNYREPIRHHRTYQEYIQ